jgi:dTDP-4-amino-4,6-dideoxygalactose transaminase
MIPRHSLPFGIRGTLSVLISRVPNTHVLDIEKAYADALGVRAAILLPSVRAGIRMSVQAVSEPGTIVAGPAYTCSTVHDAMGLSSARVQLIDPAPDSFLMPPEGIYASTEPGCLLVLSEVYGIPYDQEMLQNASGKGPRLRVFDMAMSIPAQKRMQQLEAMDVALFSFGWGKPLYAGWGGIACFQDLELASSVREIQERWTTRDSSSLRFQRSCSTLIRVVMNQRRPYGLSHQQHLYRLYKKVTSARNEQDHPSDKVTIRTASLLAPEWTQPMTALNRKLTLHNLRRSLQNAELRRSQTEVYFKFLVESGIVCGPGSKALPQSHFPIRLPSAIRNAMCDYLRGRGIDTGTLFPFAAGLSRASYPNAAQAADEVITLPLGPTITLDEVQMVSECVKDGLRVFGL